MLNVIVHKVEEMSTCDQFVITAQAVSVTSEADSAIGFFPLAGLLLPQTIFACFPSTSIPPCNANASATLSAIGRWWKFTNAQSDGQRWKIVIGSVGLRLAATIDIERMSVGLTNGQLKTSDVLTSASLHSGRPRNSSVV